jgi:hypothetical protein
MSAALAGPEAIMTIHESDAKPETSDDSATKAAENAPQVESRARARDHTLKPGGAHGAPVGIGIPDVDPDSLPGRALDPEQEWFGNTRDERPGD